MSKRNYGEYISYTNNSVNYYTDGILHRDDGPAVIKYDPYATGNVTKYWYSRGKRHRTDGPAVEGPNTIWYNNDKVHRTDGPAVIYHTGMKVWYRNGVIHRLDGPAVVHKNYVEYYLFGREINTRQYKCMCKVIRNKQRIIRAIYKTRIKELLTDKMCDDIIKCVYNYYFL